MNYIFNDFDEAPEGIDVAIIEPHALSDAGRARVYVAIAKEYSNTTTFYGMSQVSVVPAVTLLGLGLLAMRRFFSVVRCA